MKRLTPVTISFEFFPPKTSEGTHHLCETAELLASCRPGFFSVTFGAGGSTRKGTVETVTMLQQKTNIHVAPHLACIGSNAEETVTTHQNIGILAHISVRMSLDNALDCRAGVKLLSGYHNFTGLEQ